MAEKKEAEKKEKELTAKEGQKKESAKAKEVSKEIPKPKAEKKAKSAPKTITPEMKEAAKIREKMKKKNHPIFRGRFGKKQFRRKSIKKWQKWRYPRGIDIFFRKEDGAVPKIGYRVPKEFRHFHPSGMREMRVSTVSEISKASRNTAVRIVATVGKKKRKEIIKKAMEMGVKVVN